MLEELSPKEVFYYFEELSKIPRGSGNTKAAADYCLQFAKQLGLKARRDDAGNVVIFKKGSKGREEKEPVMLQGHLDMVCEKKTDCGIDMEKEGVRLYTDGVRLWAEGTTLGADDGIAVAYILAILASDTIEHPPIQAVLTSDEEVGMLGARGLNTEGLTAKYLINLDSETEGVINVSCAGGVRAQCQIPIGFEEIKREDYKAFTLKVSHLLGGHSGIEIHKGRTNAIRLLASLLAEAGKMSDLRLTELFGGGKYNVIPKEAEAKVLVKASDIAVFQKNIEKSADLWLQDIQDAEPKAKIQLKESLEIQKKALDKSSTEKVLFALQMAPDGVYKMSRDISGMVETSLNLGTAALTVDALTYEYLVRSNSAAAGELLLSKVQSFVSYLSGELKLQDSYPAWEYRKESKLREICVGSFQKLYGRKPVVTAIHAGLECGILSGKMPGLDMVSFGPTLEGVHTPDERMNISSARRTWEYLLEILREL